MSAAPGSTGNDNDQIKTRNRRRMVAVAAVMLGGAAGWDTGNTWLAMAVALVLYFAGCLVFRLSILKA